MHPILHLKDLQCFVMAYELRSFSRAADAMNTVQSQISARIHRLERFTGTALFARLPHGIIPNNKGDVLYQHAKRVLGNVAELENALGQRDAA